MTFELRSLSAVILSAAIVLAEQPVAQQPPPPPPASSGSRDLFVMAGKSVIVDSPTNIQRVSIANPEIAEAQVTSPREVLINGKGGGETSLIIWQENGQRQFFDLFVEKRNLRLEGIKRELAQELEGQNVTLTMEEDQPFLRGTVKDLGAAERAVAIASTMGRPVNLLRVAIPGVEPQILIKVRFIDVDRSASRNLGLNIFSTGYQGNVGRVTTGGFSPPVLTSSTAAGGGASSTTFTLSDALNLFFFRPDLNLGATIAALQSKNLAQILAEPNVLAINNHSANFLAGGEFPFPTLQGGGGGLGAVTIQFREFGIRIAFTPSITPRGTIRLSVTPEVSSLDFSNGLTFQGFTIPALSTRRVQTAIELESGQSFAIGGLLDNRTTKNLSKIPGLGDIPLFGKLFRSEALTKNNSELLVIVTPEIVRPIPAGQPLPDLKRTDPFLSPNTGPTPPKTPGIEVTGQVPVKPPQPSMAVEDLIRVNADLAKQSQSATTAYQGAPLVQFMPAQLVPQPVTQPPAAAAPAPAPVKQQ